MKKCDVRYGPDGEYASDLIWREAIRHLPEIPITGRFYDIFPNGEMPGFFAWVALRTLLHDLDGIKAADL